MARVFDHHDVARVAIVRQCVRNEAVISWITHRRIEKAVDEERAGRFVHFVFDGLAADRHFDNDVDVVRRGLASGNRFEIHNRSYIWELRVCA